MPEKKILIVDDSATMRQLLIMALSKLDGVGRLAVVEACDGEDAFAKFTSERFDLVLTDIKMPNLDGLELIKRIRYELGERIVPIVIISTKGEEGDVQKGLMLGANEYMLKPISTTRLKQVITQLLA